MTVTLTRRQAEAMRRAHLWVMPGVRRSRDLIEAEQRLMAALNAATGPAASGPEGQRRTGERDQQEGK